MRRWLLLLLAVAAGTVIVVAVRLRQAEQVQPPLPIFARVGTWPELELPAGVAANVQALAVALPPADEPGPGLPGAIALRCGPPGEQEVLFLYAGGLQFRGADRRGQAAAGVWQSVLDVLYAPPQLALYAREAEAVEVVPLDDPTAHAELTGEQAGELAQQLAALLAPAGGAPGGAAGGTGPGPGDPTQYPNYLLRLQRGELSIELIWHGSAVEVYAGRPAGSGGGTQLVGHLRDEGLALWHHLAGLAPASDPAQRDGLARLFAYDHLTATGGPVAGRIEAGLPLSHAVIRLLTWSEQVGGAAGLPPGAASADDPPLALELEAGGVAGARPGGAGPRRLPPVALLIDKHVFAYAGGMYFREGLQDEIIALLGNAAGPGR